MPAKESLQAKFIGLVNGKDPPNLHYHSSSLNTRLMWPQCYYKISFSGPASPWYPASSVWPPGWHPPRKGMKSTEQRQSSQSLHPHLLPILMFSSSSLKLDDFQSPNSSLTGLPVYYNMVMTSVCRGYYDSWEPSCLTQQPLHKWKSELIFQQLKMNHTNSPLQSH